MPVRRNLIAVAVLAVTGVTAAGGAAYAAGTGPAAGPATAGGKATAAGPTCSPAKPGAKDVKDQSGQERIDAAAESLGVTTQQLTDAFGATKQWVGTSGQKPSAEVFAGHVASLLGKDAAKVQRALMTAGLLSDKTEVVVKDGKEQENTHIAAAAKDLGVTTQRLTDALVATKQWVGSTSDKATPDSFVAHVASLLGLSASKVGQALDHNAVFRTGPVIKQGAPAGPECSIPDKAQQAEITTAAETLGVTDAKLTDALKSAKESLGATSAKPTPDAFAALVASKLGLSADKVLKALESAGLVGVDVQDKAGVSK